MFRSVEDGVDVASFGDSTQVHDHHVVCHLRHHAKIVGDEQDGHPQLLLQLRDEVQDLRLGRHVQRRGWLVSDQQARAAGQTHGDHRALAHATAQLERVRVNALLGPGDANPPQQLDGPLTCLLGGAREVQPDDFGDLIADGMDWTERRHRLLKDHADVFATDRADLLAARVERRQVQRVVCVAVQQDVPRDDAARWIHNLEDGARSDALTATTLANDTDSLATFDLEVNAIDRFDDTLVGEEVGPQPLHLD